MPPPTYRWTVSLLPRLIDPDDKNDPMNQCIPAICELEDQYGLIRWVRYIAGGGRYSPLSDRLIINVTISAPCYRHCQRRRNIGERDLATPQPN